MGRESGWGWREGQEGKEGSKGSESERSRVVVGGGGMRIRLRVAF